MVGILWCLVPTKLVDCYTASPKYTYKCFVPLYQGRPALRPTFLVAAMNFSLGTRRSTASSSSNTTAANPVKDDFPEALTYRFNDNSAWVPAARTHEASVCLLLHSSISPLFRLNRKLIKYTNTAFCDWTFFPFLKKNRRPLTSPNTRTRN